MNSKSPNANDSFDYAFECVRKLAKDFDASKDFYLSAKYQEPEVRKDFIDKIFIALGWDVNHEKQKNPFEQEVKVERTVPTGKTQRRTDYAFYIDPNFRDPRFFAEAKKPYVDVVTPDSCFQTIRYGWNAKTPIAVLTDFEQFIVLDCRYRPDIDTATDRVLKKYHYSHYRNSEKFAEIFYLFSRDAVADNSLEKYAETLPKRRGKAVQRGLFKGSWQPVDESFLEELDGFREDLARNFKNHNPKLDGEMLTEVTQRTLDRLVFLRFLEDKLIETKNHVAEFGDKGNAWIEFIALSRRLNNVYNGIVFRKHDILDAPSFIVDETQFADLCEELAHVNSPYDFNSIPIHILGSIYERFLGKVIVATAKRARVEEKPEVRKAGGIYYTPDYIVRYIVDNTVCKLIDGKTPTQIAKMRFADIACGSGSFLLAIYDLLLRYHRDWYNENPEKAGRAGCVKRDDGFWHLSLKQKREILLTNIYGVDIDHQAVEVAQLSLYLKLLEEETTASAHQYQLELRETLLPSLEDNIKQGNSLIASDFSMFPEELVRVRAFDWPIQFSDIMKKGGFDAVLGNPPWISLSGRFGSDICSAEEIQYLVTRYQGNTYMPNMYEYFVNQGMNIVKQGGFFSYVVPDRLGFNNQFIGLRRRMLTEFCIESLLFKVPFPGITADTLIFVVRKEKPPRNTTISVAEFDRPPILRKQRELFAEPNYVFEYFEDSATMTLVKRIEKSSSFRPLADFCDTTSGYGGKSKLITTEQCNNQQIPTLKGDSIGRYEIRKRYWFEFKPENITGRTTDKSKLGAIPKVLLRKTGDSILATFDDSGVFPEQSLYFLFNFRTKFNPMFLLGILNSKLMTAFYRAKAITNIKSIAQIKKVDLDALPIPSSDFVERKQHDDLVRLVVKMLGLVGRLQAARTESERSVLQNIITATDRQIDHLVYELYGLSEDEINIVEGLEQSGDSK